MRELCEASRRRRLGLPFISILGLGFRVADLEYGHGPPAAARPPRRLTDTSFSPSSGGAAVVRASSTERRRRRNSNAAAAGPAYGIAGPVNATIRTEGRGGEGGAAKARAWPAEKYREPPVSSHPEAKTRRKLSAAAALPAPCLEQRAAHLPRSAPPFRPSALNKCRESFAVRFLILPPPFEENVRRPPRPALLIRRRRRPPPPSMETRRTARRLKRKGQVGGTEAYLGGE